MPWQTDEYVDPMIKKMVQISDSQLVCHGKLMSHFMAGAT
jgi:hypothetical protein